MDDLHGDGRGHRGHDAASPCPLCLVRDVAAGARPDVVHHLRAAGRELARALEAALDAHATAHRADDADDPPAPATAPEPSGPHSAAAAPDAASGAGTPRLRRIPVD